MNGRAPIAIVYTLALFMTVIDLTIVNVALPTIGRELGASAAALSGVSVGYTVAIACIIAASAWMSERFGSKRILLLAIGVFTVASAACGAAGSIEVLVLSRIVQGLGAGMLLPVGLGMLYRAYPRQDRVRVTAVTALVSGLGPVLGPTLGGVLVASASWRIIFLVNIPVGLFALIYGAVRLPKEPGVGTTRIDGVGFLLTAAGLGAFIFGLSFGASDGWAGASGVTAIGCSVSGLTLLILFVLRARGKTSPLLRIRLLSTQPFGAMATTTFFANAAFFGTLFVIALYLQNDVKLGPAEAGFVMLAEAVPVFIGAQVTSRVLLRRFSERSVIVTGLGALTLTLVMMAALSGAAAVAVFVFLLILLGASWSLVFIPVTTLAFTRISVPDTGQASTLLTTLRQAASAVGIAIAATALTIGNGQQYLIAFIVLAALSAAATFSAWTGRRRQATQ